MLRTALISSLALACLSPSLASAAGMKTAKFEATFEATRVVEWNQPRGVGLVDCRGEHWSEARGSETWKLKTARPQTVTVRGGMMRGMALWTSGTSRQPGLEVRGVRSRSHDASSGTSGGWCSPGLTVDPPRPGDCGTRLPTELVHLQHLNGELWFTHTTAPFMAREKLGYDDCLLITPTDVLSDEFPTAPRKVAEKALFGRRRTTLTISGSRTIGPESVPVVNIGVERTTSATVSWKLTLKRKR